MRHRICLRGGNSIGAHGGRGHSCLEGEVPQKTVAEPLTRTKKCFQSADSYSLVSQGIHVVDHDQQV